MVKKTLLSLAIAASAAGMAGCQISSVEGNNKVDQTAIQAGDPAKGGKAPDTVSPIFSPATSQLPLANDLIFAVNSGDGVVAGVTPGADGTADIANPEKNPVKAAINDLDGFSTIAPIDIPLNGLLSNESLGNKKGGVFLIPLKNASHAPTVGNTPINPLSITTIVDVAGLQKAVAANNLAGAAAIIGNAINQTPADQPEFEVTQVILKTPTGQNVPHLRILLKKPLLPKTKYIVALTSELKSQDGKSLTESTEYTSLTGDGSLFTPRLAPVRDLVKLTENIAGGVYSQFKSGGSAKDIILSYPFTTGGTTDVLKAMAAPGVFLSGALTPAAAEGAIRASVIATAKGKGADDATANAAAANQIKTLAATAANLLNAQANSQVIDPAAANVVELVKGNAQATAVFNTVLYTAIANGNGAGLDTIVDRPKSRTFNTIPGAVLPYNDLLTPQITAKVEAEIKDITTAEGAITKSIVDGGGSQAAAGAQLDIIAGQVAVEVNKNAPGTLPTTDGATIRPTLKSNAALQPAYLKGLQTAIITGQLSALSSGGSIRQGGLTIPSFLPEATVGTADSALGMWRGSNTAAVALGRTAAPKDKDNTANVSYRFPFAHKVGEVTVPVLTTLPAASCDPDGPGPEPAISKPADGWPVVIYQHGITVDRTAGLLVGNALAKQCIAMVAIDHVAHGIAPLNSAGVNSRALFNVEQVASETQAIAKKASPFAAARAALLKLNPDHALKDLKERHNNVAKGKTAAEKSQPAVAMTFKYDANGQLVEADSVGQSADLYINLQNFGRTRDHIRQTVMDLLNLNASIDAMDVDGNGTADDLNPAKVYFIGHSLGGIVGTTFLAVNNDPAVRTYSKDAMGKDLLPQVRAAALGNPGGGIVKLLENSPGIGAQILAGLANSSAKLKQGDASLETFFSVFQATVDSGDPINFAPALKNMPVLVYEDVGGFKENADATAEPSDQVVPNNAFNPAKPSARSLLAGTDPLVTELGITDKLTKPVADAAKMNNQGPNGTGILSSGNVLRQNVRISKGTHSTFSSADPQDVFAEEYLQIVTFFDAYNSAADYKKLLVKDTNVLEVPAQ